MKLVPSAVTTRHVRVTHAVAGVEQRTDERQPAVVSRKLYGPLQQRMAQLLEQISHRAGLSERSRKSARRLGEFNWSADIAALATLVAECPGLVEEYLNLMACSLHEFPSPTVTP